MIRAVILSVSCLTVSCLTLALGCAKQEPVTPPDGGAPVEVEVVQPPPPDGAVSGDQLFAGMGDEAAFPAGLQVRIDSVAVDPAWLQEVLGVEWVAWQAEDDGAPVDQALRGFFAEPQVRCATLLEGVLLDREARERFPELDAAELAALGERLGAVSGGRMAWHRRLHGDAAAQAYLERDFRRRLLEDWFAAIAEEVGEEEVFATYEREVLRDLPPPEQREGFDVSYETRGPQIRERLQRERGRAEMLEWLAGRLSGVRLVVQLPDGTRLAAD